MGSVTASWGVWQLHGECGGSMGSVAAPWRVVLAPWGVCWLHGECGGSIKSVAAP